MEQQGWVKVHRNILDWEWYKDTHTVHLFIHLLISANHEPKKWRGITIARGQLVTGRKALSQATGIPEQSIRTSLARLKSTNEVTSKSTNKYTIYTIVNYDKYQNNALQSTTTATSKLTNDQPATNHKQELKELKNYVDDVGSADIYNWLLALFGGRYFYQPQSIKKWLEAGADFELDIKPVAESYMKVKQEPPRSLSWLDEKIVRSINIRKNPLPEPTNYNKKEEEDSSWMKKYE